MRPAAHARRVPEDVIATMHAAITADPDSIHSEGWDQLIPGPATRLAPVVAARMEGRI